MRSGANAHGALGADPWRYRELEQQAGQRRGQGALAGGCERTAGSHDQRLRKTWGLAPANPRENIGNSRARPVPVPIFSLPLNPGSSISGTAASGLSFVASTGAACTPAVRLAVGYSSGTAELASAACSVGVSIITPSIRGSKPFVGAGVSDYGVRQSGVDAVLGESWRATLDFLTVRRTVS